LHLYPHSYPQDSRERAYRPRGRDVWEEGLGVDASHDEAG
jgi:hypothetical protein